MNISIRIILTFVALNLSISAVQGQSGLTGKIVYGNGGDLYLLHLDNGLVQRLTTTQQSSEYTPKLSSDGTRIVFYSIRKNIIEGIYVMFAAPEGSGNPRVRLTSFGVDPAWSPDGTRIAFRANDRGIWVMNADGSGLRQLTTHGGDAAWSPDSAQIVFVCREYCSHADNELHLVNANASSLDQDQQILAFLGDDVRPAWAPSAKIVFAHYTDSKNGYDLFTFDPVTLVLTQITVGSPGDNQPAWSPDATWIVFSRSGTRITGGIYIMPGDGSQMPTLIVKGGYQPSWGP
ncbi:MAG: PD40 domain-containing protein [Verrucomicrobia bacterium]|nr:PD40 domain-containing protein [Verrucomicrobiota bacterium]